MNIGNRILHDEEKVLLVLGQMIGTTKPRHVIKGEIKVVDIPFADDHELKDLAVVNGELSYTLEPIVTEADRITELEMQLALSEGLI